ncbi:type II toxin-antitoxin system PemK/MazF family toxin [Spongiactinospora sp. 9N601]|uniref:type II toxin-antitoxin system PemK/MazF family toxin n=1 Tax=Spongiactinospora sp. 9N601 TaxID=3375149 RepID=UPI0037A7D366
MRRGDVYWVEFDPVQGSETDKSRPAVVVSNDAANRSAEIGGRGVVTVVPITSNIRRVLPFQVLIPARTCGLRADSKAQAEQVRAVSPQRIRDRIGRLTPRELKMLDGALRLHLGL